MRTGPRPASLRFRSYLSRRLEGLAVGVLVAGRRPAPEAANPLCQERASAHEGLLLRPQPLSAAATAGLVRGRLGEAHDEFCRACHAATSGNSALFG
jgi:hypothetical protein